MGGDDNFIFNNAQGPSMDIVFPRVCYSGPKEDFLSIRYVIFFSYYVTYYGDARRVPTSGTTITIGDNVVTTDGSGTRFTNPPPEVGVDYYVFIRLYSGFNVSQTYSVIFFIINYSELL